MAHNEEVWVVPKDALADYTRTPGFSSVVPDQSDGLLELIKNEAKFYDREAMEVDPTHLQIIPYVIATRPYKDSTEYYFYQRTGGGGDSRLHGAVSVGLGGHINPIDEAATSQEVILNNIRRELDEEVDIFDKIGEDIDAYSIKSHRFTHIGNIYSDDSPVSAVHFGMVYQLDLTNNTDIALRETYKMRDLGWVDPTEEEEYLQGYEIESWSEFIIDHMKGKSDVPNV